LVKALPQIPLGELTVLPDLLAGFKGPTSKVRKGRREGKGKGRASRIFSSVCWQPYGWLPAKTKTGAIQQCASLSCCGPMLCTDLGNSQSIELMLA